MTVKVVILNWNGAKHLERFLPSVVSNTPEGVGIVVADNGSTDGSVSLLEERFPSVEIVRLPENYGFAEGYNRALSRIEADCYILLNSDVETPDGWCRPLTDALEADSTLAAVSPKIMSLDSPDTFEYAGACGGFIDALGYPFCRGRILSVIEKDRGQYDTPCDIFWASGACMACRSDVFHAVGGFDADFFAHQEEIDLCWRMQKAGYRIGVVPASRVYHLGGGTLAPSPRKNFLNFRNNLAMLYKNLPRKQLYPVLALRMLCDGVSALAFLLKGQKGNFMAVYRAHEEFRKWLPNLKAKRRAIAERSVIKSTRIYKGSIVIRYILGRRTFGRLMS